MKTLQLNIPDEVFYLLDLLSKRKEDFVIEAILEKIETEKKKNL